MTGRRAAPHCAPVGPGTPNWSSCLQGPPGCRRGDPSSSRQSRLCCHCRLGGWEGEEITISDVMKQVSVFNLMQCYAGIKLQ